LRKILILMGLSILIFPAISQDTNICNIIDGSFIACEDKEQFKEIMGYLADGDNEAAKRAYLEGALQGTCTTFEDGESVYLESNSFWDGLVCLRRAGEAQSFWTAVNAVQC
jgi:hypothetical protein